MHSHLLLITTIRKDFNFHHLLAIFDEDSQQPIACKLVETVTDTSLQNKTPLIS